MTTIVHIKIAGSDEWVLYNKKKHKNAKIVQAAIDQPFTSEDLHVLNSFKLHIE